MSVGQNGSPIVDAEMDTVQAEGGQPEGVRPARGEEHRAEPKRVGEYLVRRLLGEGGMGRVYEAEERLSKRRVALKVLREELSRSETARALFVNEMQILAHLEHPNVVRSHASFEAEGKLVIVLELLEGRTLRELLGERERLGWQEAAYVVACIASALEAAHGQVPSVIHRDLKPENVMLLADGTVKVMDFGIAKLVQELNQTNTQSVGTLQYMSPEQIDARPVDGRTDLYCLGHVCYELLSGVPPFSSASPRLLLNMQCTEAPPPLSDEVRQGLPQGIRALLGKMLEKDKEARPSSASSVRETLEMFLPPDAASACGALVRGGGVRKAPSAATTPQSSSESGAVKQAAASSARAGDGPGGARDGRESRGEVRELSRSGERTKSVVREDTVALVERVGKGREIPTAAGVAIILAAIALAAAVTWQLRAATVAEPAAKQVGASR